MKVICKKCRYYRYVRAYYHFSREQHQCWGKARKIWSPIKGETYQMNDAMIVNMKGDCKLFRRKRGPIGRLWQRFSRLWAGALDEDEEMMVL